MRVPASIVLACVLGCGAAASTWAQGFIVPHEHPHDFHLPRHRPREVLPETTYRVRDLVIDTSIRNQVAQTRVTQSFENTGRQLLQAIFVFPLPADAAIESLTFLVDGREIPGKLLPADEARGIYEGYVRQFKDPALLQWIGQGMFQTSVFPIPPGARREVVISYSQLLRRDERAIRFVYPLATARFTDGPLDKLSVRVAIENDEDLKNIYSPSHEVTVQRDDARHAIVRYSAENKIPADDFRLIVDAAEGAIGARLVTYWPRGEDQGYFLLLASPRFAAAEERVAKKTLMFVIDRSGSMSGEKIEQAREAAKFVIQQLRDEDLFNIVAYDEAVNVFRPELQRWSEEARSQAIGFVNNLHAGGSTNIDGALQAALGLLHAGADAPYLIFLTDGLPTAGEQDEMKIVQNAAQGNRHGARLVTFGVGYDVNSRLLDRLARANRGQSEYVRPDENIEAAVSRLASRIASPVLTDIRIEYGLGPWEAERGDAINRVYPEGPLDLFRGDQLVIVGRYRKAGAARVALQGQVGQEAKKFEFDLHFSAEGASPENRFVEKLWAGRRIGEIIDLLDLRGRNPELIEELTRLSQRHGILTPYTSFLADENQSARELSDLRANARMTGQGLAALDAESGESAFAQRSAKQGMKAASNLEQTMRHSSLPVEGAAESIPGGKGGAGIRNENGQTVYRRGQLAFAANASDVDPDAPGAEIQRVKRFSDEYFRLVRENSAEENELLAMQREDEELIVRLRGAIYRIQ